MRFKPQRGVLTPAQGNALGKRFVNCQALKGRPNHSRIFLERPYRAFLSLDSIPRALPWAKLGSPLWG